MTKPIRLLLGPQRPIVNLAQAIDNAGVPEGPLAVISAGWQEAEDDIDDVRAVVGRPLEDVRAYHRAEEVFKADERLGQAYRGRQDRLNELQRLYRLRLTQLAIAARQTLSANGDHDMIAAEQRHAIAQLRALDRHHLTRGEAIRRQFDDVFNRVTSPLLARNAREITEIVQRCPGVLITGGNIVVVLNRMRLFGLDKLLKDRHVIAWSAGAMALAERIVLFHDRTPQGSRDPEILGAGFGIVPGFVVLPDVARRLQEADRLRIGLMCRRFSPEVCVALNSGAELRLDHAAIIRHAHAVKRLNRRGGFSMVSVA